MKYNGKGFQTFNLYEIKKTNRKAEVSFGNKEVETERWKGDRFRALQDKQGKNTHTPDWDPQLPHSQPHKRTNK